MPQGVDISEHQASTPGGFEFYLIRLLNENGRQDYRWEQHYAAAAGRPRGAYGIILPGAIDPHVWADRFIGGLHSALWECVPTIDIELGDPAANRDYAAVLVSRLHAAGFSVVMGYYSKGSAYRFQCEDLFQRQWLAAWGSGFPAGADVHQWQGSPLDLDYCPDLSRIGAAAAPPTPRFGRSTDVMFPRTDDGTIYLLAGGWLRPLSPEEWSLLQWEYAVQNGGQAPKFVQMDNGLRLIQLARIHGVSDADISLVTGIPL